MTKPLRGESPMNRQARQERAQEAALNDLEAQAEYRREKTGKLRKLRLAKEKADASRFKSWRDRQS